MLAYHLGMNNKPVYGRSSETQSHLIHIGIIIIMVQDRSRKIHTYSSG